MSFQGKISKIVRVLELKSSIFQISWSNYLNCLVVSSHFKTVVCNIIQKTFCEAEVAKNGKFGSCLLEQNIYIAKSGNKLARSSLEGEKSKMYFFKTFKILLQCHRQKHSSISIRWGAYQQAQKSNENQLSEKGRSILKTVPSKFAKIKHSTFDLIQFLNNYCSENQQFGYHDRKNGQIRQYQKRDSWQELRLCLFIRRRIDLLKITRNWSK